MGERLRALIVEDSENDAALVVRQLRHDGYEVEHARVETGEALRRALAEREWDIVLSDYNLPELDALAALEAVREAAPELSFIVVSGTIGEDKAVEAMRKGANDYLLKDNLARLGAAVARELKDTRTRRERAAAERSGRESESRYRVLFDFASDAMLVLDAGTGEVLDANLQARRLLRRGLDELAGMRLAALQPPGKAGPSEEDARRGAPGPDQPEQETEVMDKDGKAIPVIMSSRVMALGGRDVHLAAFHDMRAIKEAEDALRLSREQLYRSQKLEAVGRLAGGVAHDFNNLLTAITGFAEFLDKSLEPGDTRLQDVAEIKKASARAAALTRQLLAFSRKQVLQVKVLTLSEVVSDMEKLLRRTIPENISLSTVLDPGAWPVRADANQLGQVILNLAVNSCDAMPAGGKLIIETANLETAEPVQHPDFVLPPGGYAVLAVSDTGCGMSREIIAHAFEPFFTTKEQGKGTGLGLATVYGIVRQSGGHISLYSAPGRGTTVKVYLPRTEASPEAANGAQPAGAAPRGAELILVAEDDELVRRTVRRILGPLGYALLEAKDGAEAVRIASNRGKDVRLLLTDLVMPELDGRRLAERVKAVNPAVKVLFMSGYTDAAIIGRGMLEPGSAFLHKPFAPLELARKVREVLDA